MKLSNVPCVGSPQYFNSGGTRPIHSLKKDTPAPEEVHLRPIAVIQPSFQMATSVWDSSEKGSIVNIYI